MHSLLVGRSFLSILIILSVSILEITAFWKMFEKAGEHGRYIFIPGFNLFVLSRIARRTDLFLYMILGLAASIIFGFLGLRLLFIVVYLLTMIMGWMITYSIAKNFGRTNSAALVFVVSPINYLVLGFSDDEYMYKNGQLVVKKAVKTPIDENILKDIENEIHTKHLGEINNANQNHTDDDFGNNNSMGGGATQPQENIQPQQNTQNQAPQNIQPQQNVQNVNNYNYGNSQNIVNGDSPSIYR